MIHVDACGRLCCVRAEEMAKKRSAEMKMRVVQANIEAEELKREEARMIEATY